MHIYEHEITGFGRDTKRSLRELKMRRFERTWWFTALAILIIPLILLWKQKPPISVFLATGFISSAALYV